MEPKDEMSILRQQMKGNIDSGAVQEAPEKTMGQLYNDPQPSTFSASAGHKKQLLGKLMSNLLNKPNRSMHEIINGVKAAIGAYKNYSKEYDTLNGIMQPGTSGGASAGPSAGGAMGGSGYGSGDAQRVMREIAAKKAAQQSAPSMPSPQAAAPAAPAAAAPKFPALPDDHIGGQPQVSSFNRPAPVSSLGIYGH